MILPGLQNHALKQLQEALCWLGARQRVRLAHVRCQLAVSAHGAVTTLSAATTITAKTGISCTGDSTPTTIMSSTSTLGTTPISSTGGSTAAACGDARATAPSALPLSAPTPSAAAADATAVAAAAAAAHCAIHVRADNEEWDARDLQLPLGCRVQSLHLSKWRQSGSIYMLVVIIIH